MNVFAANTLRFYVLRLTPNADAPHSSAGLFLIFAPTTFPFISANASQFGEDLENWKTDLSKKSAHSPKRVGGLCNLEQIEFVKQLLSNSHATLNFTDVFSSRSGHTSNGIVVASTIAVVVTYNLTA